MVENTGEKASAGRIRPLNRPAPIQVRETPDHAPASVTVARGDLEVIEIRDTWDLQEEWWRSSPIDRRYYHLTLSDGRGILVFHDLLDGRWYTQKT